MIYIDNVCRGQATLRLPQTCVVIALWASRRLHLSNGEGGKQFPMLTASNGLWTATLILTSCAIPS